METVQIEVAGEGFTLEGIAAPPAGPSVAAGRALALCHPHPAFGGTMDSPVLVALARAAERAGLGTLRFNFRGIGASGGAPTGGGAEHRDVVAAVDWLRARGATEVALAGYSFGSLMAARAIAGGLRVAALVAIALPTGIVTGHQDRIAELATAFAAQPTLLLAGSKDPLCDPGLLRAWAAGARGARLEELAGVDHFPAGATLIDLCDRAARFVADSDGRGPR